MASDYVIRGGALTILIRGIKPVTSNLPPNAMSGAKSNGQCIYNAEITACAYTTDT
jgi:hypothetical protein